MSEPIPVDEFLDEFGETINAIYTDTDGVTFNIKIILDHGNINVPVGESSGADTKKAATCKTADVDNLDNTCRLEVTIDDVAVNYYITDYVHDGQGLTVLTLSKEAP